MANARQSPQRICNVLSFGATKVVNAGQMFGSSPPAAATIYNQNEGRYPLSRFLQIYTGLLVQQWLGPRGALDIANQKATVQSMQTNSKRNLIAMASTLVAMASNVAAMASNLIAMASDLIAMASALPTASSLIAMASTLVAMASTLVAMASNLIAMGSTQVAMASNLIVMAWHALTQHFYPVHCMPAAAPSVTCTKR